MEFKGTTDLKKWTYEYDGDGMRFNGISVYVDDCYEKYREDTQLISKAPELLAKLQYLYSMGVLKDHEESVLKLIKEATEL